MESPQTITVQEYTDINGNKGIIKRRPDGRFAKGMHPANIITSTEQSVELLKRRRDKAKETALQAVNLASAQADIPIPDNIETDYIGWYAINNDLATSFFTSDNLRSKVDASKQLGINTGMIDKSDDNQPGDINISSDLQELIRNIADIVRG